MEEKSTQNIYDCIVVGGGISGVSFAHYLRQKGHSVLIVEKENRLGGCLHSITSSESPDYWREMGAHTCYNSYTGLLDILRQSGNAENIIPLAKASYVLYTHKEIKSVVSEMSLFSLARNFWKYFSLPKAGKTTREFFESIVGKDNYDHLFTKLFRAVISQEADDYPAEIFLKSRKERDKSISKKFTYQGGLTKMLQDIAQKSGAEIMLSSSVGKIEKMDDGLFQVSTSKSFNVVAKRIAIATDVSAVPKLIEELGIDTVKERIQTIAPSKSIAINLLVDKSEMTLKKVAGIISLGDDFYSAVSRDTMENEKYRSFTFHFPESTVCPAERLETMFHALNLKHEEAAQTTVTRHILPAVRMEHLHMGTELPEKLAGTGITILGNYFLGMSIEDCVQYSKKMAENFDL